MFNSKNFPLYLSLFSVVIVLGYIRYANEKMNEVLTRVTNASPLEDGADLEGYLQPIPAITFELPEQLSFAGEAVPMDVTDVRERLDKELHINTYWHNNTIFLIKRASRWFPQMEEILKAHNIPEDFKYLPLIESGLMNDVSPKEAVGFWQILKSSGKELGLEITHEVDERYDPLKSTEAACKYLKKAHDKFGNWTMVAASYNRGMGGMERAIENQKVSSYYDLFLNEETSRYVFRILACKEIIENPTRYGFIINPRHLYQPESVRYITVNETIQNLVDFAQKSGTNYKLLKRHNPWLREDKLTVKKGKVYSIALPV
jgi:membrane-bound lytic murein transglycosylase D